jgi:hypothetical protein
MFGCGVTKLTRGVRNHVHYFAYENSMSLARQTCEKNNLESN